MNIQAGLDLLARVPSVLAFLLGLTLMAECAWVTGVFDVATTRLTQVGRHRVWAIWLLFLCADTVVTAFLSLDTTAVLMTSLAVALARRLGKPIMMFAAPTLWLANMGSMWLPVSNLTNLLARNVHPGSTSLHFLADSWPVALTTTVVPILIAAVMWRGELKGRTAPTRGADARSSLPLTDCHGSHVPPVNAPLGRTDAHELGGAGRATAIVLLVACVGMLVFEPWVCSLTGAFILLLIVASTQRERLREIAVPWRGLGLTAALFVAASPSR